MHGWPQIIDWLLTCEWGDIKTYKIVTFYRMNNIEHIPTRIYVVKGDTETQYDYSYNSRKYKGTLPQDFGLNRRSSIMLLDARPEDDVHYFCTVRIEPDYEFKSNVFMLGECRFCLVVLLYALC